MRPADIKMIKHLDLDRLIKRNSSTVKAQDLVQLNVASCQDEMQEIQSYKLTKPNFFIKTGVINFRRSQKISNGSQLRGQENEAH